jgi:hypothetical protein
MPTDEEILGFSNRWYPALVKTATECVLGGDVSVKVVSAPYLIATNLEAFRSRGNDDYLGSKDIEDIVVVLDGREEVVEEIAKAPLDVRLYIIEEFGGPFGMSTSFAQHTSRANRCPPKRSHSRAWARLKHGGA